MKRWWQDREDREADDVRTRQVIQKMDVFLTEMQRVADRLVDKLSDLDKKEC